MAEDCSNIDDSDNLITVDRNPVPLAFCAYPTSNVAEDAITREEKIVEQFLDVVDPIIVTNPNETRQAPSLKSFGCDSESEFEFSGGDESDFENLEELQAGGLDSDEEFDRFVKLSAKIIEKTHKSEYPRDNGTRKCRKSKSAQKAPNIREYDDMPPLENLSIECKSNLIEFGFVSKVVDCQVVVVSTCADVLDFDSFLFDQKGNAIGQIYDIFGQVKTPQYVIRFNSSEEASLIPIDMKVYYAPTDEQFSKTPFKGLNLAAANREAIRTLNRKLDHQEAVEKVTDCNQIAEVDSEVEFSDDEAEKEYRSMNTAQANPSRSNEGNRGNRKRNRRGRQNVRFVTNNTAPKPYRRDYDPPQFWGPAPPARPPQSTEENPYAEFGCHGGFNGRFGI
uniref:H/ACA ribonucleoprotein complex non-core subunit NAF1 n=1 Tax=Caenorhabditis tropicalis TaxID=1561998 RepID=A0A1I7TDE9_9PELO